MKLTARHVLIGVNADKDNPKGVTVEPGTVVNVTSKKDADYLIESGAAVAGAVESLVPAEDTSTAKKNADDSARRDILIEVLNSLDVDNRSMFGDDEIPLADVVQQLDDRVRDVSQEELAIVWGEMKK